jgi:hypothetical protein
MIARHAFGIGSAALLSIALAACGSQEVSSEDAQAAEDARVETNSDVSPAIDERVAIEDTAVPAIEPLAADRIPDIGATALTCSFRYQGSTLLITGLEAEANSRGKGVVQIGGTDRILTGTDALGAEGMRNGPTMTDGEFTINVVRGPAGQGTRDRSDTLIVRMNMANERRYSPGSWTCGK